MNKFKALLVCSLIFLIGGCATSKVYVPEASSVAQRTGFLSGEEVDLVIYDGRLDKEASKELVTRIQQDFQTAFPSAKLTVVPESEYYKSSAPNKITVKIGISTYAAAFGSRVSLSIGTFGGAFFYGVVPEGMWNGVTGLSVNVFDRRNKQEQKYSMNIGRVISMSNLLGYATAKQALFQSYNVVINETVSFVENSLMK